MIKIVETKLNQASDLNKNIIINSIIIDDTGTTEEQDIYELNNLHASEGYKMFRYNYYIRKNGYIFTGRNEEYSSDIDDKYRYNLIGILLEGDFDKEEISDIQFNALIKLVEMIRSNYNFVGDNIYLHSELNGDYGPGNLFPYIIFKNRLLKNFKAIVDRYTNVKRFIVYKFGSRNLEFKVPMMLGQDIYQLKVYLRRLGYKFSKVDMYFDEETKNIVKIFQEDYKLNVTGIVDKDFYTKINNLVNIKTYDRTQKFKRILKITSPFMKGDDIFLIKRKLWSLGYLTSNPDNVYDNETKNAVINFEREHALTPNGVVNPLTFNAILNAISYKFVRVLELTDPIMEGPDVLIVQEKLYSKGYPVDLTGYYDTKTYKNVMQYQLDNNLLVDGKVDSEVFNLILK